MHTVTPTIFNGQIASAQFKGRVHIPMTNTTLNEKFNVQAQQSPSSDDRHITQFYCIGNRGHRAYTGADGRQKMMPVPHSIAQGALYGHIPFILRELTDDLNSTMRSDYALRVVEQLDDGNVYVAYYAKRLDLENVETSTREIQIIDGQQHTRPWVPTSETLDPDHPELDEDGKVIQASGEFLAVSSPLNINFNAADAEELRNVARILYGSESDSVISEIALVSGIRRMVTGEAAGNNTINYQEAIATQCVAYANLYYQMNLSTQGFSFTADVGSTEPLYVGHADEP